MCRCSAHAELENSRRTYSAQENLLMRKKQEILLRCGVLEVRMRNWKTAGARTVHKRIY